jgi:hypothetical protein
MNYQRPRWVLRTSDGKILVGQSRQYEFRHFKDVKDARIATYMSEKKAMSAVTSQGWDSEKLGIYAEQVWEAYVSAD